MVLVEIIPNLWISNNNKISSNMNSLYNIKHIINTNKDLQNFNIHQKYNHDLRERMLKYENTKKTEYFKECINFINNNINKNGILIYCKNLEFNVIIILIYLIIYGKLNFDIALNIIKSKIDSIIVVNDNYLKLIKYICKI